jgi:hypothetical protein
MVWIFPALLTLTGQQRLSWRINDVIMRNFWIPKKNVASFDKGSKI